jgi:DNA polymerase III delta subunit
MEQYKTLKSLKQAFKPVVKDRVSQRDQLIEQRLQHTQLEIARQDRQINRLEAQVEELRQWISRRS